MSKSNETLSKIKEVLGLSTEKEATIEEVKDQVVLADEVVEEVKEEVKAAPAQAEMSYATAQELSQFKSEVMEMFKQLLEENKKEMKEVPMELAKETPKEVELAEEPKEIVHSPENEVEAKQSMNLGQLRGFSTRDRINAIMNNLN